MILTIVGTHEQPFDRLVKAVDGLVTDEERVIQYGYSSYRPIHCRALQFVPFAETMELMRTARVVITHAGTGSVMSALALGKRPIVVPRLKRFGEHVDDHQLQLVEILSSEGRIIPYLPGDELSERINEAAQGGAVRKIEPDPRLVRFLIDAVARSV